MLLHKVLPGHHHAGEQSGAVVQLVPLLRQVQGHPQVRHLALGHSDEGLGQQGNGGRTGGQGRHALTVLALPVHHHVGVRIQAVFRQQIPQGILRRRALAGGHDGLAGEVRHGLHGVAVFHHVQNAQGVDCQRHNVAAGLVVEHGGQVRRHAGDVQVPLHQRGGHLVGGGCQGEFISVLGGVRFAALFGGSFIVAHELHHAHGGGALQRRHPGGDGELFHSGFLLGLLAAGGQRQRHRQGQQQRQTLLYDLHGLFPAFLSHMVRGASSPPRGTDLPPRASSGAYTVLAVTPGSRSILPERAEMVSAGASMAMLMMLTPRWG